MVLPPKTESVVPVDFGDAERAVYDELFAAVRARFVEPQLDLSVEVAIVRAGALSAQCVSQGTVEGDALANAGVPVNAAETGHPVFRGATVVSPWRRVREQHPPDRESCDAGRAPM